MASTVVSPGHEALESTIHGLVEEFFEMLGDGEAWSFFGYFEICCALVNSTVPLTQLPQVQMRRIQSLLCSDLNAEKRLETQIRVYSLYWMAILEVHTTIIPSISFEPFLGP